MSKNLRLFLKISLFFLLSVFLLWLLFLKILYLEKYSYKWDEYFYIWLLLMLVYCIWSFRMSSKRILIFSIYGYLMGVFLVLVNLSRFAEFIMVAAFLGFIVGTFNALIEYRRNL